MDVVASGANALLHDAPSGARLRVTGTRLSVFFGPTAQDEDVDAVVTAVNYAFHATP